MKIEYKNYYIIYTIFIIYIILLIIYLFYGTKNSYIKYNNLMINSVDNNNISLLVKDKDLDRLYKNKTIYINGNKHIIKIDSVIRNIKSIKKIKYNLITTNIKNIKVDEKLQIMIYDKKIPLLNIFKYCWRGDNNSKD